MPIYIDSNELREGSPVKINNPVKIDNLEENTGADIMLSLLDLPPVMPHLIQTHIDAGAVFVQRKSGNDLVASVGERMNDSLSRMQQYKPKPAQCVLLFIGVLVSNHLGCVKIGQRDTEMPFMNLQGAISKWHDRGGVYESIPMEVMLNEWCLMKLRHLEDYKENPEKTYLASPPDVGFYDSFLQQIVMVKDGRRMLACLPGVGQKTANKLWEEFDANLAASLCWLTMEKSELKIPGIGRKTKQNIKEYLGVEDVMCLGIEVDEDVRKEMEKKK